MKRVAILGLGYVGLPLALYLDRLGFDVVGIDIDVEKIHKLESGQLPYTKNEPRLLEMFRRSAVIWTSDYRYIKACSVVIVCVATPAGPDHRPDYTCLNTAIRNATPYLSGKLLSLESTLSPGTTRSIRNIIPEDTLLGCCPERVMPGKMLDNLMTIPRVAGADDEKSTAAMRAFYGEFVANLTVTDTLTAEITKAAENTFRDVQIAFANELAVLCEDLGVDVWQVRQLINAVPGRNLLCPGGGVGGHCIPKDPWLLLNGRSSDLIEAARRRNDGMPFHVAMLAVKDLLEISGKTVLILGYAYLPDTDDVRNSPSVELAALLKNFGIHVLIHDPFIPGMDGDVYALAQSADLNILMTAHSEYSVLDWKCVQPLIDARGVAPLYSRRIGDGRRKD